MSGGDSTVKVVFGIAVLATVIGLGWLAFGPAPRVPAPVPTPVNPRAVPVVPRTDAPPPVDPREGDPTDTGPVAGRPFILKGEVKDVSGTPVPGATIRVRPQTEPVHLAPPPPSPEKALPEEMLRDLFSLDPEEFGVLQPYDGLPRPRAMSPRPEVVAEIVSGEDGRFTLEMPAAGPWRVEASTADGRSALKEQVRASGTPLVLVVSADDSLRGIVLDADSRTPVAGAVVQVVAASIANRVTTGEDGRFTFAELPTGRYSLSAGAKGFALERRTNVEAAAGSEPLEILLGRGYAATITVSRREPDSPPVPLNPGGPTGPPVEGARVVLMLRGEEVYASEITGPDGTVRFEGLCEGNWRVAARKEGLSTGMAREIKFSKVNRNIATRDIGLFPLVETPVRVIDPAGAPVQATFHWSGMEGEFDPRFSEKFGATGPDGTGFITFDEMVDRKSIAWVVPAGGFGAVALEPDDAYSGEELTVVVRPGRIIHGRVTDAEGKPVAGAIVSAEVTHERYEIDLVYRTVTDADGRYKFLPVPHGETYVEVDTDTDWLDEDVPTERKDDPLVINFQFEAE